ncbi:unnamed protein product [Pocillopora meandrina]|uniref:Uncharacterized protein n=1 Tax=Pocillopora meandrina TaxID=46732 RepID=A0AAU9VQF3_9CNID|nr:unnamed protein product [Pocillopora meandrina]
MEILVLHEYYSYTSRTTYLQMFLLPSRIVTALGEIDLHGGLVIRDDLMAEGENDTKTLDLFPKHSHHQNITVMYFVKIYFYKENTSRVF